MIKTFLPTYSTAICRAWYPLRLPCATPHEARHKGVGPIHFWDVPSRTPKVNGFHPLLSCLRGIARGGVAEDFNPIWLDPESNTLHLSFLASAFNIEVGSFSKNIRIGSRVLNRILTVAESEKEITHLLQWEELKASPAWQIPFHLFGMGPIPSSLKLFDSGHTPKNHKSNKKLVRTMCL